MNNFINLLVQLILNEPFTKNRVERWKIQKYFFALWLVVLIVLILDCFVGLIITVLCLKLKWSAYVKCNHTLCFNSTFLSVLHLTVLSILIQLFSLS